MRENNLRLGKTGSSTIKGRGRIQYDISKLDEQKRQLRILELEKYVVSIPEVSGHGLMVDGTMQLARTMKDIYDETTALILACENMLDVIKKSIETTDNKLAAQY